MTLLAAHADWSKSPRKRWLTIAKPGGRSSRARWHLRSEPVGDPATLIHRLLTEASGAPAVLGVDAPIGLPAQYAHRHWPNVPDFPTFLRALAPNHPFFDVCDHIDQVTGSRPFFPNSPLAGPRQADYLERLGAPSIADLMRECDRRTPHRAAAACLFWTLGANQVGKAALAFWHDVLLPALQSEAPVMLWPFAGRLADIARPDRLVVAETYPAEALAQRRIKLPGSKRRQTTRCHVGPALRAALADLEASPDPDLAAQIDDGFGHTALGEDRFDSLVGLLGVLGLIADPARDRPPLDHPHLVWEGWILGQAAA